MNGERLRQVRELLGWTQAHLAELVEVQQGTIAALEREARVPSDELLERIASVTGFPVAFFEERPPIEFPLGTLLYRKFARLSSQEKARAHRIAQQIFNAFLRMGARLKVIPLRIPKKVDEDPITAARLVRSGIGFDPETPIKNLINRLERHGVLIITLPDEIEDLDAFSTWVDGTIPVIVLSSGKPGDRQRWNVSHELGHLILHQSLQGGFDAIEHEANQFAAELLLPEGAMKREIIPPVTLSSLAELKPRWGVALQTLITRALELEIITYRQAKYLRMQISRRGWIKDEPQALYIQPEKPRALRKMAEILYGEQINYKKLADDMHLPTFFIKRVIESYAGKDELGNNMKSARFTQGESP
jgi:Zn-dependent peptidase ImmA (M78 family)/DNA-binding XRE family transcriptional regulator